MSQHDLDIANQGFPATRADINNALQALGSSNSGATAPSTTYANQLWYDTANNIIKIRNEDNDAWISLFTLDQTNDNIEALTVNGTVTADALTVDTNTLHVDATNNNVGIGTTSIEDFGGGHVTLEVAGSTTSQGGIFKSATSDSAGTGTSGTEMILFTDSTNGGSVNVVSSDSLRFLTANTERGRFLAGGGLTFNGDTAAANALDDYETGTHVTSITCSTSGTITLNTTGDTLSYTKIGNLVNVRGMLQVTSVSSPVGRIEIDLPFTVGTGNKFSARQSFCGFILNSSSNVRDFVGILFEGNSNAHLYLGDALGVQSDSAQSVDGNEEIYISATYRI